MRIVDQLELNKVAKIKIEADQAYNKAWATARDSTLRLPVDRFWEIMDTFGSYILNTGKHDIIKYACDELFRQCITDTLVIGGVPVTFDELVSFIENWQAVTAALHQTLFDIVSDKGDDGYSDLCDNLPLIGRRGVAFLLGLDPNTNDNNTVIKAIKDGRPSGCVPSEWLKLIWDGENYWRMFLEGEAKRRYPYRVINHTPHDEALV